MQLLFVMDPLDRLNLAGDSTFTLMADATARGWECAWCTPDDLFVREGQTWAVLQWVRAFADPHRFARGDHAERALGDFDVVWMRKDPPFDMAYIFTTYLLEAVPRRTVVLNDPRSIRSYNEKLVTLRWPHLVPQTLVTREVRRILAFAAAAPDRVVLKPWDGNGGRGVLVSRHGDGNLRAMAELLTADERSFVLVQHYVPEIAQGDKRIILVDGEPLGWMLRVPQPGDHRGNMHAGARVVATELTPRDREICATIGPLLREEGLLFVGIDVIGSILTEINVTSPTGIQEVRRLMGVDLAAKVGDAVAALVARRRQERGS
jgi:glutathione synthase